MISWGVGYDLSVFGLVFFSLFCRESRLLPPPPSAPYRLTDHILLVYVLSISPRHTQHTAAVDNHSSVEFIPPAFLSPILPFLYILHSTQATKQMATNQKKVGGGGRWGER